VSATASSGLTISYSITKGQEIQASQQASYSAPVCSLSQSVSGQVLFLRSGECEITATQAGDSRYAQGSAKISILIGQLNQFITFAAIPDQTYGAPTFRLSAVASSNLPVSFTVSAGVSACSVADGMVTITAAGVCEIRASQAGNGTYAPAPNVIRSFTVTPDKAGAPALVSAAVGNQWFTVRYTAPSYTGGSNILGYRLEVRNQSNGLYLNSACPITEPFTCTVVGIPNSVSYTARIAAITSAGIGNFSNNSVPLTPSLAAMSVTQLSAQTSISGLEMSWITPQAIDGNFLRYEVYAWEIGATEPTTPTTTLTNASDAQVSIDLDSIAQANSISPASYTAPSLQIVQPLYMPNSRIHVFGAVRTAPVGFFTLASISQPNTESASVGYNLRVVTITDTRSVSQEINTANGIKLGLSTPSAPTQLNLDTSNPDKITITWAAPNSDGGFPLESYQVKSNGRVICVDLQARVCELNPLDPSTVYDIEVQAKNALGFGAAAQSSHTTPEPPVQLSSLQSGAAAALIRIPEMNSFTPRLVRPGSVVSITGTKLNTIRSLALDELGVDFLLISETQMRFRVPESIQPGTYDVVHTSEYGKVTVLDAILVAGDPVNEELEPVAPKPKPGDATATPTPSPQQPAPGDAGGIKPEPTPAPSDSSSSQGQGNASEPGEVEEPQEGQSSGDASEPELDQNPGTPPVSPDDSRPETNQTDSQVALPVSPVQESQLSIWLLLALLLLATGVGLAPRFSRRNREQGID
jgi:hypothetical protein